MINSNITIPQSRQKIELKEEDPFSQQARISSLVRSQQPPIPVLSHPQSPHLLSQHKAPFVHQNFDSIEKPHLQEAYLDTSQEGEAAPTQRPQPQEEQSPAYLDTSQEGEAATPQRPNPQEEQSPAYLDTSQEGEAATPPPLQPQEAPDCPPPSPERRPPPQIEQQITAQRISDVVRERLFTEPDSGIQHRVGTLLGSGASKRVYASLTHTTTGTVEEVAYFCIRPTPREVDSFQEEHKQLSTLSQRCIHILSPSSNCFVNPSLEAFYFAPRCIPLDKLPDGSFSTNYFLQTLVQIANGLNFLHEQNLVHGDIKPQNILLQGDIVKFGDLGTMFEIRQGIRFPDRGTVIYLPPEFNNLMGPHASKFDVWSLGCMLFQYLSKDYLVSKTALQRGPFMVKMELHQMQQATIDTRIDALPNLNEQQKTTLKRLLSVDPTTRFNAIEAAAALDSFCD